LQHNAADLLRRNMDGAAGFVQHFPNPSGGVGWLPFRLQPDK
jgi:hypothetical protein